MLARSLVAVCIVFLTAAVAAATPIHYVVSSLSTADPSDGYGQPPFPVELDATLDHMTGFVDIHRFQAISNGQVAFTVSPHSAQLTKQPSGIFEGDTPHGQINFHPLGFRFAGWAFYFYPVGGSEGVALSIRTAEPASGALLAVASLGLLIARRNLRRTSPLTRQPGRG